MHTLIDGKQLALDIQAELATEVYQLTTKGLRAPHLAAVLVGDNPASHAYVRNKVKACERAGFTSTLFHRSAETSQEEIIALVHEINTNPEIDGFIVQLPLPKHIDEQAVNLAIDPKKDVDGFHPTNFGLMTLGMPTFLPATPYGILLMLERYQIPTEGKHCVVLGRSNIVGTPMTILLSRKANPGNATVTICHSRTKDIVTECKQADILIAAIGRPFFVQENMVKEGAVVIDVGINRVDAPERKRGYKLVGDVDFEKVAPKCSHITPVPGGVGPMTVAALLKNTMKAYQRQQP